MSIKAEQVSYRYTGDEKPALDSVSLEIKKGGLAIVCGRNGSGKTTLLRCLSGLTRPSKGSVTIAGQDAARSRHRIGFAIQFPERMLFERTALEDVAFGPRNMGISADEVEQRVESALHAVGLGPSLASVSPRSLSHGQKRLLAIACAIAHRPEYLFLDEPAAGLDSPGRRRIIDLLLRLNREGMTIVVASHDPVGLLDRSSQIIVLDEGHVIASGRPSYAIAKRAGIRSDTMKLAEALKSKGMDVGETFSPEVLADRIAEAIK